MQLRKLFTIGQPGPPPASAVAAGENVTLLRHLGRVQQLCTRLITELQQRIAELEAGKLRLHTELHRCEDENARLRQQLGHHETSELLCRTGCLSLDQPWRDERDRCRLDGRACPHTDATLHADAEPR